MMIVPPHKINSIVRNDGIADQTMRAWMDELTDEVNGRFVVGNEWVIRSLGDFKRAGAVFSGDEISVPPDTCISVKSHIDITPYRLILEGNAAIVGTNAETASLYSNISSGSMIYSNSIVNLRDITLSTSAGSYCVEVDGTSNPLAVVDWFAVNFTAGKVAKFTNLANVNIILIGILDPDNGIDFFGTFGTIATAETILSLSGSGKIAYNFDPGVIITRRIRFNFCAFVISGGATGVNLPTSATIPDDTFIIFFCNFAGGGAYISGGLTNTSLKSRWYENRGITNTYRGAMLFVENNATATTITTPGTYYKMAGITAPLAGNSGLSHSNNRLTSTSVVSKLYDIKYSVTFTGTANNVAGFKIYQNGVEVAGSKSRATANAAGRAENVTGFAPVVLALGDYVEIWTTNETAANAVTGVDYNLYAVEI
jgi:hypothetical protein